ncbi:hypothetical protein C7S16_5465 [Burkholderia thailandensis]|uniref:Uncharacterized protein n=1 Tax=Burkholderia thailandensis TaxID=57975 RepID=A0AAW9CN83_BURTH|nr:hypothetical protein [Burkholderia thailandensis]MDW9252089.1 hypothetical protein [Burkholderia thailandensis]
MCRADVCTSWKRRQDEVRASANSLHARWGPFTFSPAP